MNILNRLKKLESSKANEQPCFCGNALFDMWRGAGADGLTYCPKCKDKYEFWARIADEASELLSKNLTDA